jgi:hypothetical protein
MWFELQDNQDENQNQFLAGGLLIGSKQIACQLATKDYF